MEHNLTRPAWSSTAYRRLHQSPERILRAVRRRWPAVELDEVRSELLARAAADFDRAADRAARAARR